MKTIYTKTIKKTLFIGIQIKKLRIKVLLLENTKKMMLKFLIRQAKIIFSYRIKIYLIIKCLMMIKLTMGKTVLKYLKQLY